MKRLIAIIMIFLLTGCYNYHELNDLAIVKGASIDIENNEYVINYIIDDIQKNDNSKSNNEVIEGRGSTISDAVNEINLSSPKELYTGHMLLYIVSEKVARKGIIKVTDFFFRNSSSKKTFNIFVAKNAKAKDILKVITNLDKFQTNNLVKDLAIENSVKTDLISFLKNAKDSGIDPILNGISQSKDNVKIEPLALFKNDKFIKWENERTSNCIALLTNQLSSLEITIPVNDGYVVLKTKNLNVKKSAKINQKVEFEIVINGDTEIVEMTSTFNFNDKNNIIFLQNMLIEILEKDLNQTIYEIKNSKIDSIGLGKFIYQNDYNNWLKIKDDYLDNLEINFIIKSNY